MKESRYRNTKKGKQELRRLTGIAFERALRAALTRLDAKFADWRKDRLDTFALNDSIHDFYQGEHRELWALYERSLAPTAVARAVAEGLLDESELSSQLREDLAGGVAYFRER